MFIFQELTNWQLEELHAHVGERKWRMQRWFVCMLVAMIFQNLPSFTSTCSCRSWPTRSTLSGTVASKLFMVYTPQSKVKSFKTSTAWIKGSKLLLGDNAEILMPYISVQGLTWLLYLMKLSLEYFRSNIHWYSTSCLHFSQLGHPP